MKILKLLNNKNLSIITTSLFLSFSSIAEDKPVDIWNIDKQDVENTPADNSSTEKNKEMSEDNIYKIQSDKNVDSIKLDQALISKEIKIVGLYDPEDHGLSIDMWLNSDGLVLKKIFKNINKVDLPATKKEIEKIITNENFKIVK